MTDFESLISNDILKLHEDGIDALINKLGKTCELIYQPRKIDCPNCVAGIGGKSANTYVHGGPIPFRKGTLCPLCGGDGFKFQELTENVTLLVTTDPQGFEKMGNIQIETPNTVAQTKGYISDLPKIIKAKEIIIDTDKEPIIRLKFKKLGEASPRGFKHRYFIQNWEQIG